MARKFTSGAEFQSTTADHEIDSVSGTTISIDTAIKRSGAASWKFVAAATGPFITRQYTGGNNDTYARAYIYVQSMTTASNAAIFLIRDATNGNNANIRLNRDSASTFHLELWNEQAGAQVGSDSATLNTGQWYRVEFSYVRSTGAMAAYVDGVSFASGTGTATLNSNTVRWGSIDSSTMTINFDDIAINDNTGSFQNGLPGDGKVIRLSPDSAGDANTFATQTGGTAGAANSYTRVSETTFDDATTFNGSSTLNQEDLFNFGASGIGSSDTVNVVEVWGRYRNSTADTAAAVTFELEKTASGTKTTSSAIVPNSTTWRTNANAVPKTPPIVSYQDPSSASWTQTTLDSLQAGYKLTTGPSTGSRRVDVSNVSVIVDYTPVPNTTLTVADGAHDHTADNVVLKPATANHQDNFHDNSIDTTKWNNWGGSQVAETNHRLEITTTLGGGYYGIDTAVSSKTYTLIDSYIYIEVPDAGNQSIGSWEVYPIIMQLDSDFSNYQLYFMISGGTLYVRKNVGGTTSVVASATYSATSHRWFRIREVSGMCYLDTSPDGATWNNFTSLASPFDVSNVRFGPMAGTWAAELSTTTAIFDNINVVATALTVQDATHAHTADNLALTQAYTLAVADASHDHTADNVVLEATNATSLTVQDSTHAHAADSVTLTQAHTLAVNDATHAHAADNVTLTQVHTLAVQDASHAHTTDGIVLIVNLALAVADSFHGHTADNPTLTQAHTLAVQDATHAHTSDSITITTSLALVVADATHGHTADAVTLTQSNLLAVQDALHAHTADAVAIIQVFHTVWATKAVSGFHWDAAAAPAETGWATTAPGETSWNTIGEELDAWDDETDTWDDELDTWDDVPQDDTYDNAPDTSWTASTTPTTSWSQTTELV